MVRENQDVIYNELNGILLCLTNLEKEARQMNFRDLADMINDAKKHAAKAASKMELKDLTSRMEATRADATNCIQH